METEIIRKAQQKLKKNCLIYLQNIEMLGENEPDRLRLERKINQYMNPRRESNQSANE